MFKAAHVTVMVDDLDRAVVFYTSVLNLLMSANEKRGRAPFS